MQFNICYLDINFPDFFEDYSYPNPKRYGGGKIFCAAALYHWDNLYLYADKNCFDNITEERILNKCFELPWESRKAIREGAPIKDYIKNAQNYDLFFHHHVNIKLNLEGLPNAKTAAWSLGVFEHNFQNNLLLYSREYQNPQLFVNENIYDVVIGKDIKPFEQVGKQPYIFQCSRHNPQFSTNIVASWAHKYNFNFKFAGPIEPGFQIDIGGPVEYLGIISEEKKVEMTKNAMGYSLLHQGWEVPFSLSLIEALSVNTPIICTPCGFLPSLIKNGVNGFLIQNEEEFINALNNLHTLNQQIIYNTSLPYSTENMLASFRAAFEQIVNK